MSRHGRPHQRPGQPRRPVAVARMMQDAFQVVALHAGTGHAAVQKIAQTVARGEVIGLRIAVHQHRIVVHSGRSLLRLGTFFHFVHTMQGCARDKLRSLLAIFAGPCGMRATARCGAGAGCRGYSRSSR